MGGGILSKMRIRIIRGKEWIRIQVYPDGLSEEGVEFVHDEVVKSYSEWRKRIREEWRGKHVVFAKDCPMTPALKKLVRRHRRVDYGEETASDLANVSLVTPDGVRLLRAAYGGDKRIMMIRPRPFPVTVRYSERGREHAFRIDATAGTDVRAAQTMARIAEARRHPDVFTRYLAQCIVEDLVAL